MTLQLGNITVDCADALVVGTFWSTALGRPLDPGAGPGFASIGVGDLHRTQPAWLFERVPEAKTSKNRMHVDLVDPDPTFVARLVSLGARVTATHSVGDGGHGWTVMQDPEGNEFCVGESHYSG